MVSFTLGKEIDKDVFCLVTCARQRKNSESYSISKHDAINIADPSSMQDACHALPLWLSGRALDPRISRYKVQFNIGIQNFFFVTRL